jgi:hypothetical protein
MEKVQLCPGCLDQLGAPVSRVVCFHSVGFPPSSCFGAVQSVSIRDRRF